MQLLHALNITCIVKQWSLVKNIQWYIFFFSRKKIQEFMLKQLSLIKTSSGFVLV